MIKNDAHDSKANALRSTWLFSSCNRKEIALLESACDEVTVNAGSVLCEEGKVGKEFCLIISGTAKVTKNNHQVAILGPGDAFGELSLLDHLPRSATVIAETNMDLMVLPAREFTSVLEEIPSMALRLLEAMAKRLRAADDKAYS